MNREARVLCAFLEGPDRLARARALIESYGTTRALIHGLRDRTESRAVLRPRERQRILMAFRLVKEAAGFSRHAALVRPVDVVLACQHLWTGMHEELWAVAVDGKLRPLHFRQIARGGPAGTSVQLVDVVRPAVGVGAAGLFVLHNHPSGQLEASPEDMAFTRALRDRCEALGLALHDHLVVAGTAWFSCITGQRGSWLRACA